MFYLFLLRGREEERAPILRFTPKCFPPPMFSKVGVKIISVRSSDGKLGCCVQHGGPEEKKEVNSGSRPELELNRTGAQSTGHGKDTETPEFSEKFISWASQRTMDKDLGQFYVNIKGVGHLGYIKLHTHIHTDTMWPWSTYLTFSS